MLLRAPRPVYPAEAREQRITGRVTLHVLIGTGGTLLEAQAAAGHPLLVEAALAAVHQWLWRPTIHQGVPVEVISRVDLEFNLPVPSPPCH
jgi:protein TonB